MKRRSFFAAVTTALGVNGAPEADLLEQEETGDLVVLTKEEHDALLQKLSWVECHANPNLQGQP